MYSSVNHIAVCLIPTMSEFSNLKQQRKAKEAKSYISAAQIFTNDPDIHPTGPILNSDDDLFRALPPVLHVLVNEEKPELGRGIYSKTHWKPGE